MKIGPLLYLGLLLAAAAILHAPTLDDPFHGDDFVAFRDFYRTDFLSYSDSVFSFTDSNFYWRPLGSIFHRLLYEGFGLDAFAFRLAGLIVFLLTLAAVYAFCIRARLGTLTALGAVAVLVVVPNHVVSVAWVTNTSRLMAILFVVLALLVLQNRRRRFGFLDDVAALALFLAAVLSDETALALAPVPVLFAVFCRDPRVHWRSALARVAVYALLVAYVLPLQFDKTLDDEPRLAFYGIGPHVTTQAWALVNQLVLPLAPASPVDVYLATMGPVQWAVGLGAIVAGAILLVMGTRTMRLLVVWAGLALAPFTLWDVNYTSPRYVYMAAIPFAVVVSWLAVTGVNTLRVLAPGTPAGGTAVRYVGVAAVILALHFGGAWLTEVTRARNEAWSDETRDYGLLAGEVERREPAPGSRIVVFYSKMTDFWASVVAQTIAEDPSVRVANIPKERAEDPLPPFQANDLVFYLVGDRLMPVGSTALRR